MASNPDSDKRPVGRPANITTPIEAPPVMTSDAIMGCRCDFGCGRNMVPRVIRRRTNGERDVECTLCGHQFIYNPATIRNKC